MQLLFDLSITEIKAAYDLPEMWTAGHYQHLLQALEFEDIEEIETADLPEMAVMALQDLKPEEAAEAVLKLLLGDRLHAGIRQNLAQEMKQRRSWEEYGDIECHAGLFLTAVLIHRAFPKEYPRPEICRLLCTVSAENDPGEKLLAVEPSAALIARLLAAGMDDHSILKRLYAPQLAGGAFPEAPSLIWYTQVQDRQESAVNLLVYSSWYWLRPLAKIRQYQAELSL